MNLLAIGGLAFALSACSSQAATSTVAGVDCKTNADCMSSPNGTVCNMATFKCVVCAGDSTCGAGQHCDSKNNKCVQCIKPADCSPGTTCGPDGTCHTGCDANSPCPSKQVCLANACVQCAQSSDCMNGRCDPNTHTCVACLADTDCPSGNVCRSQMCVPGCSADQHCPSGKVCDLNAGACVQCTQDSDCKGSSTPRCDVHTNSCVACLPGSDNCGVGQYCANESCVSGCKNDVDCAGNSAGSFCNLATNQCAQCNTDSQCGQGMVCGSDHTCTTGCHSDANCGVGQSCCNGQCAALNTTANCGVCGNACGSGQACCGNQCLNINSVYNCGGCGITCGAGQTCTPGGCSNLLTDVNNCGAAGNKCASGQTCCSGFCKNPNQPGVCVDCTKSCAGYTIAGQQFSQFGSIDQLSSGNNGISTQPQSNAQCSKDADCANVGNNYFCLAGTCSPRPALSPYVWVANHDSNQLSLINSNNGSLLGTYGTSGTRPSRGAQALDGSFWIAHRGAACACGADYDPNQSNVANVLPDGTIRCVIKTEGDGITLLPFVRALAIDKSGYVWVGTWNSDIGPIGRIHKIDPVSCKSILDMSLSGTDPTGNGVSGSAKPYGMTVDGNGILWVSTIGSGPHFGIDTSTGKIAHVVGSNYATYGLTADRTNNIYFAAWCTNAIMKIPYNPQAKTYASSTTATSFASFLDGNSCARGMTVDTDGNVWGAVANWNYYGGPTNYAIKLQGGQSTPTSSIIGVYREQAVAQAVYINGDPFGNVWMAGNLTSGGTGVIRFPRTITTGNQIDFQTRMIGGWPYSYADSTGIVLRTVTSNNAQDGTWTMAFDGQQPQTTWETATWVANMPVGTQVKVRFRAAASAGGLQTAPICGPFLSTNGVSVQGGTQFSADLTTCNFGTKQWLGAYVELSTNDVTVQPTVSNFKVYYQN